MTTVLEWLVKQHPTAKRQTLRRMISAHRVLLNGVPAKSARQPVAPDDKLRILDRPSAEPDRPPADALPFKVVFEDQDVIVIDKPPGLLTSGALREKRPTVLGILRRARTASRSQRIGLVHRLDRDASGLLVLSKNDAAHRSLKKQFRDHTVDRVYTAAALGSLPHKSGKIASNLVELPDGIVRSTTVPDSGRPAITHYQVIGRRGKLTILRLKLHTGRKHQIRAHLKEQGTPIAGDPLYGPRAKHRAGADRLLLTATELAFDHPRTGRRVSFNLPAPAEMTPDSAKPPQKK